MIFETYIIPFLLLIAVAYGFAMILLQFAVREHAFSIDFRQMLEKNPIGGRQSMNYRDNWMTNYHVFRDSNYIFCWGIVARAFSTIHAVVMTSTVVYLCVKYGLLTLWDYDFYRLHPEGMKTILNLNAFMLAYLTVDVVFLVIHYLKQPIQSRDGNFFPAICHHIIGAICMIQFIRTNQVHFKSLYYSFTEISTITLNIVWFAIKMGWDKSPKEDSREKRAGQTIYKVAGYTTFVLFFVVRVLGSLLLIYHIYVNIYSILKLSYLNYFFAFVGNSLIVGLNYYWFYKLSLKAFGKS